MVMDLEVGMEVIGDVVVSTTTEEAAMVAVVAADTVIVVEASQAAMLSRWDNDERNEIEVMVEVPRERITIGHQSDHTREATMTIHEKEGTKSLRTDFRVLFWVGLQPCSTSSSAPCFPVLLYWEGKTSTRHA